jgi:phytoene synthase
VTRREAANFYYGIRLLPAPKRDALCAIYALARRIDDIGDGELDTAAKLAGLAAERVAITQLATSQLAPRGDDPVLTALAAVDREFPLPREAFLDLIDGVGMDVVGTTYETFDELVVYCRRVAGTIGRLCLAVFGSGDPHAAPLADDLGVALQLTNILRDVREDAVRGRVYLPAEDLRRFGWPEVVASGDAAGAIAAAPVVPSDALSALVGFEAARGREWFVRGGALVPLLDRRSAACVLAMSGIYRTLLDRIEAAPESILAGRVSLPVATKARVAVRSLRGRAA